MKRYKIAGLFIALMIKATGLLYGQDAKADFKNINYAYAHLKSVSVGIEYTLFADHKTSKVQEKMDGEAVIAKDLYYNNFKGVEVLRDKSVAVVADHPKKLLILQSVKMRKNDKLLPVDIDSELKSYKSVSYKNINESRSQYDLSFIGGKVERIVLEYDTKSYLIEKLVIYYRNPMPESGQDKTPPRVEISYAYHPIANKKGVSVSAKNFFTVTKGKYVPKEPYRKYQFVNMLNK